MIHVQFGRGLSDSEIMTRLLMSFADNLEWPVHWVPAIEFLPTSAEWPRRGILYA